jgi:hypothetical protein
VNSPPESGYRLAAAFGGGGKPDTTDDKALKRL